ncbi:putative methyltransferase NSUN7 isoform X1 [Osmerus eperlanus]
MVMLYDFQDRKFLAREWLKGEEEESLLEVQRMEGCLYRCKTKLAASLARCRVKQDLVSISCLLSDQVRTKQRRARTLPLYAWVNTFQSSVDEVCEVLHSWCVCEVGGVSTLEGCVYCHDPLGPDMLVFPAQLITLLQNCHLTKKHTLNIQDRSVCLAACALRPLLSKDSDVLVVGSFSALTLAHIAVRASACSARVLVCGGEHSPTQREQMQRVLAQMDIKNVRVLSEDFRGLDQSDSRFQRLKVILILPQCSSSALHDPVETLLSEHGDCDLLQDLSKGEGSVSQNRIHALMTRQTQDLTHALSFPKVQAVVYCTRSVYPEENELLVKRVLEKAVTHHKLLPYKLSGPVLSEGSGSEVGRDTTREKFFKVEPSEHTNGCFIALLAREADPVKVESVQDVLARAAAKGLLGGILTDQSHAPKKGRQRKTLPQVPTDQSLGASSQEIPSLPEPGPQNGGDPGNSNKPSTLLEDEEGEHEREEEGSEKEEGDKEIEGEEKEVKGKVKGVKKKKQLKKHHKKPHGNFKNLKPRVNHSTKRQTNKPAHQTRRHKGQTKPRTKPSPSLMPIPVDLSYPGTPATQSLTPDPLTLIAQQHTAVVDPLMMGPKHSPTSPPTPQGTNSHSKVLPQDSKGFARKTYQNLGKQGGPNKETDKPGSPNKVAGKPASPSKEIWKREVLKSIGVVLPPISSPSVSSMGSKSVSLCSSSFRSTLTPSQFSPPLSVSRTSQGQADPLMKRPRPKL